MIFFVIKALLFFFVAVLAIKILTRISERGVRFKFQTESYLSSHLPKHITLLSQLFEAKGYKLYLVGGCIRDIFLHKQPKDYDLCTDLMPDKVQQLLQENEYTCQLQGE